MDGRPLALYTRENGTLYVLAPQHVAEADDVEDPTENPIFREIVLHVLIHHVQWSTGAADAADTRPFPSRGEEETYLLGGRYLRRAHATDPIPSRNFWAQDYSTC